jgi:hypothetical protein
MCLHSRPHSDTAGEGHRLANTIEVPGRQPSAAGSLAEPRDFGPDLQDGSPIVAETVLAGESR